MVGLLPDSITSMPLNVTNLPTLNPRPMSLTYAAYASCTSKSSSSVFTNASVAAGLLRLVEREVGQLDQLLRLRVPLGTQRGRSQADGHAAGDLRARVRDGERLHALARRLRDGPGALGGRVAHQEDELLAA